MGSKEFFPASLMENVVIRGMFLERCNEKRWVLMEKVEVFLIQVELIREFCGFSGRILPSFADFCPFLQVLVRFFCSFLKKLLRIQLIWFKTSSVVLNLCFAGNLLWNDFEIWQF
jgi:hypothetical protein